MVLAAVGRIGLTAGAAALAWYGRRQQLRWRHRPTPPHPLSLAVNLPADRTLISGELVVLCSSEGTPVVLQRTDDSWDLQAIAATPGGDLRDLVQPAVLCCVICRLWTRNHRRNAPFDVFDQLRSNRRGCRRQRCSWWSAATATCS